MVADGDVGHARADFGDHPRALVPAEHRGPRQRDHAVVKVLVAVAATGGSQLHQDLALLRRVDLDTLNAPTGVCSGSQSRAPLVSISGLPGG